MKTAFHTIIASAFFLSTSISFAHGTEPDEPIKTNLNSCTNCKGDVFTLQSDGLSAIRLLDEYKNLIDVNNLNRDGDVVYTFEDSGLYYLELVSDQGDLERKVIIVPE